MVKMEGFHVTPDDLGAGRVHDPAKAEEMAWAGNNSRIHAAELRKKGDLEGARKAEDIANYHEDDRGKDVEVKEEIKKMQAEIKQRAERMDDNDIAREIRKSRAILDAYVSVRDDRMNGVHDFGREEAARLSQEIKDKMK